MRGRSRSACYRQRMRNWRWYAGACAVAAVLIGIVLPLPGHAPGAATPMHAMSDVHGGVFRIEGKQVPLPPGQWQVAGRAVSGEEPHRVLSVALVRLNGDKVDAAVLIQTNRLNADAAWGKAPECDREDLYFAHIRYASDHDGSCAYAAYVDAKVPRATTDPAWQATLLAGDNNGWHFPDDWVEAAYRISDPRDAVQVRYLFKAHDHPSADAIHELVSWTEAGWYNVGSGFRNRLDGAEGLPDWPTSIEAKTLAAEPPVSGTTGKVEHVGAKTITWRIVGTMSDMTMNYLWLGSVPSAGGLAIVSGISSSVLYFMHEWVWNDFEHPAVAVADLPGVGIEGPGPRG
jgi:uncharacterized membrane protein